MTSDPIPEATPELPLPKAFQLPQHRKKLVNPRKQITLPEGVELLNVESVEPESKARITIVERVTHQVAGDDAYTFVTGYDYTVGASQPYLRKEVPVKEGPTQIETGWIDKPDLIVIRNEQEKRRTRPSEEELAESAAKVIEVKIDGVILLKPGETLRFRPDGEGVTIRCQQGDTTATVLALSE